MASPVREGTLTSSAFSSRDIDILKEKIDLTIDKDFKTGFFKIEYIIRSDSGGIQIPLLFYAADYKDGFSVSVDGKETELLNIPAEYLSSSGSGINKFSRFSDSFTESGVKTGTVTIFWEEGSGNVYELSDLKYFETGLTKGEHVIKVEYTADAWLNLKDWIKEYSFRYSLSPAKHWRSFDSLIVNVNSKAFYSNISTNLGEPAAGNLNSSAEWVFTKIPAEFLIVNYSPHISGFATALINLGPTNLTAIFSFVIILIHILFIMIFRKNNPSKKFSWIVMIGSFIIPLLILLFYIYSFYIIDSAIGPEAGKHHGYTFLVIIVYPLIVPVYWFLMWITDRIIKKRSLKPV